MTDNISFLSNEDIEKHVKMVMSQTNYTKEQAKEKLQIFNYDYIKVIKDFMKIPEKKVEVKTVNQEIYKQIRHTLDESMRRYNEKNPVNIDQIRENIQESQANLEKKGDL
jgi:phage terminase Nu1 subunit (DNA packaging protein)